MRNQKKKKIEKKTKNRKKGIRITLKEKDEITVTC